MNSNIYNGMIVLNKKNITKIFEEFCSFSGTNDIQYVSGMIGMMNCFGVKMYRMGNEWVMMDKEFKELGRKTIDNLENN